MLSTGSRHRYRARSGTNYRCCCCYSREPGLRQRQSLTPRRPKISRCGGYKSALSPATATWPRIRTTTSRCSLNDNNHTWVDYGRDDFEVVDDFTYDLVQTNVRTLSDIQFLKVHKLGIDGWCARQSDATGERPADLLPLVPELPRPCATRIRRQRWPPAHAHRLRVHHARSPAVARVPVPAATRSDHARRDRESGRSDRRRLDSEHRPIQVGPPVRPALRGGDAARRTDDPRRSRSDAHLFEIAVW